ncbi:LysR family transcriptional regulator [bacterium]|nr:LysR family transcriptional regulator [bacterium]
MLNGYAVARNIRFRHIRCFLEIASEKSISRAAENLRTVQPALSRTLKELEEMLGTRLFDRGRDGLALTEAGKTFLKYASGGMNQIVEGIERISTDDGRETVIIGAMPSVLRTLLPACVRQFKLSHPNATIRILTGSNGDLLTRLRSGGMDFAAGVTVDARGMEGLHFERISNEDLVFAVTPEHPLSKLPSASFEQINAYPVVAPLPRSPIRDDIENYFLTIGAPGFSNLIETASLEFARAYAIEDGAVLVFPRSTLDLELESGELVYVPFTHIHLFSPTGLVFATGRKIGAASRHLADIIRERSGAASHASEPVAEAVHPRA